MDILVEGVDITIELEQVVELGHEVQRYCAAGGSAGTETCARAGQQYD